MRIVLDLSPEDVMSANDRPTHWARAERTRRIRDAAFTAWFRAGRPQFERLTCVCTVDYPDRRKRDAHKPIPPISPAEARAAALSMANTALRLDAAADLPRVPDALGLREAS